MPRFYLIRLPATKYKVANSVDSFASVIFENVTGKFLNDNMINGKL